MLNCSKMKFLNNSLYHFVRLCVANAVTLMNRHCNTNNFQFFFNYFCCLCSQTYGFIQFIHCLFVFSIDDDRICYIQREMIIICAVYLGLLFTLNNYIGCSSMANENRWASKVNVRFVFIGSRLWTKLEMKMKTRKTYFFLLENLFFSVRLASFVSNAYIWILIVSASLTNFHVALWVFIVRRVDFGSFYYIFSNHTHMLVEHIKKSPNALMEWKPIIWVSTVEHIRNENWNFFRISFETWSNYLI